MPDFDQIDYYFRSVIASTGTLQMNKNPLKPPFTRALTAEELASLPDSEIDFSDIPETTEDFWKNAILMQPGDWKKPKLTIRLDADIIAFFKAMGPTYQTRINEVLRAHMEANHT